MQRLLSSLLLASVLLGCGSKKGDDPKPQPDNTVYLRVTADWTQSGLKATAQKSGTTDGAVSVALPANGKGELAKEKTVFVAGDVVTVALTANSLPILHSGKVVAELVRGTSVLGTVEWINTAPPTWRPATQTATVEKVVTLP